MLATTMIFCICLLIAFGVFSLGHKHVVWHGCTWLTAFAGIAVVLFQISYYTAETLSLNSGTLEFLVIFIAANAVALTLTTPVLFEHNR
jgi:hypothetical protein